MSTKKSSKALVDSKQGYAQFFQKAREQAPSGRPLKLKQTPHDQFSGSSSQSKMQSRLQSRPARPSLGALPEKAMHAAVTKKIQAKKQGLRPKAKFPLASALFLGSAIALGATYVMVPQALSFITSHVDIGFLTNAEAATEKTSAVKDAGKADGKVANAPVGAANVARNDGPPVEKNSATDLSSGEKVAANTADGAKGDGKSKDEKVTDTRGWTTEELSFFNKLNERKVELDQRDAELTKLEGELQQQKTELDQKIQQLTKMRTEISGTLKSRVDLDQEKIDKLVQVYSGMKAPQAAKILESVNEDLAVEILDKMKKKSAAEVLNVMEPKKAQKLSEMLAGYSRTPASTKADTKATDGADKATDNKEGGD